MLNANKPNNILVNNVRNGFLFAIEKISRKSEEIPINTRTPYFKQYIISPLNDMPKLIKQLQKPTAKLQKLSVKCHLSLFTCRYYLRHSLHQTSNRLM